MSQNIPNDLDPETIVKQKLTLYLSAYYLAERFNKLEGAHFEGEISTDHYQKLMQQLKDDKFGDWWVNVSWWLVSLIFISTTAIHTVSLRE